MFWIKKGATPSGARRPLLAHSMRRVVKTAMASIAMSTLLGTALADAQVIDARNIPSGSPLARPADAGNVNNGQTANNGADQSGSSPTQSPGQGNGISTAPAFEPVDITPPAQSVDSSRQLLQVANAGPALKPPASPGEFEQYLERLAGRSIKRFGSNLLLPSDRDFSVPATATIPPDYAVNVGDVIAINLTGSVDGSARFKVDTNGKIFLPKVGSVSVVGVRNRDLRTHIARAIGTQYRGFDVSVSIAELRGVRVYVTGFANHPGAYTVSSLSTLVNAVLAAGGPNAGGSFRMVQLYRDGHMQAEFDLYAMLRNGDRSGDPTLENEDVLFIPPVGPQVAVLGSVNEEAIYEARPGETMEQLLQYAGGANALADPSRIVLYRLAERASMGSREIPREAAHAEAVAAGDILQLVSQGTLAQPLERQSVLVRLEGEVNRPGNYFVAPNTSLAQLVEKAGGLTSRAYVYGTQMSRDSVRAQQRISFREAIEQMENSLAAAPLTGGGADPAERAAQTAAARAVLERLRNAEPDGRLVLPIAYGATNLPGDLVLENNDRIVVPPVLHTVGVYGSVYRPASFLLGDAPVRVDEYIERAGGTTRTADRGRIFVIRANGEVLTRNRGAMSAVIQPGDMVFVPSKTHSYPLIAKLRDISTILFQFGLAVAAVAALQ